MVITYEDVIPSIIPNTTMVKSFVDGVARTYRITPNEGYVLHHKGRGYTEEDEETGDTIHHLGYSRTYSTCPVTYDFTPVTVTDENGVSFTGYGANEYAARLESEVPADQIFGVGGNDHEVI